MVRRHANPQGTAAIGPALVGLVSIGFSVDLSGRLHGILCHLHCVLLSGLLEALPKILVGVLQSLESYVLVYPRIFDYLQWVISAGPVLRWLMGAV